MLAHDANTTPSNTCDTPGDLSTFATAEAGALSLRRSAAAVEVSGVQARMTRAIRATSRTEFAARFTALMAHATTGSQALAAQGALAVLWHCFSSASGFVHLTATQVAAVLGIDVRTWHVLAGLLEAAGLLRPCGAGYQVPWSQALEGTTTACGTSGFLRTSSVTYAAVLARVRRAARLDGYGGAYALTTMGALEVLRVTRVNWGSGKAIWGAAAAAEACSVQPQTWDGYLTLLAHALVVDRDGARTRVVSWERWQVGPPAQPYMVAVPAVPAVPADAAEQDGPPTPAEQDDPYDPTDPSDPSTQQTATSSTAAPIDAPDADEPAADEPAALARLLCMVGWLPAAPPLAELAADPHAPAVADLTDPHAPAVLSTVKARAVEGTYKNPPFTPPRSRGTEDQEAGQDFDHQTKTAPAVRKQRPSREPRRLDECRVASQALQARVPVLGRASTAHVSTRIREFVLAGWSVADVVAAMDTRPDGTRWPHDGAHGVGNVGGWLAYRLAAWRDEAGTVTLSVGQRAQGRVDAAAGRAAARHEQQRVANAARPAMDSAVVGDALAEMRCVAARSRAARLARLYA